MTQGALITAISLLLVLASGTSWGYRDYFTLEQKAQLAKVQTVLVEVTALTDNGAVDSSAISEVAIRRMKELGYNVVTDPAQPHDVVFKVKCEQRKTWEGTTTMGSDADLPDSPSRVWKGPACQLNYVVGGTKIKWQKEVRTDFLDAVEAAQKANAGDPGLYAMAKLKVRRASSITWSAGPRSSGKKRSGRISWMPWRRRRRPTRATPVCMRWPNSRTGCRNTTSPCC